MAIHEWSILYGHVLTLREFFQVITNKSIREFQRDSEVANLLTTRYVFEEARALKSWYERLKYDSLDDEHGCRFFQGILPEKLELFELAASQCEDAHLPAGSVVIGYVFHKTEQFAPVYPLPVLQVTPEIQQIHARLCQETPHERLRARLLRDAASVIMVIDECMCC